MRGLTRAHGPSPRTFFTGRTFWSLVGGFAVFATGHFMASSGRSVDDVMPPTHAERAYVSSGVWGSGIQHATNKFLRLDYAGGYQDRFGSLVTQRAETVPESLRNLLVVLAVVVAFLIVVHSLVFRIPMRERVWHVVAVIGLIAITLLVRFPAAYVHSIDHAAALPSQCSFGAVEHERSVEPLSACSASSNRGRLTQTIVGSTTYAQHHQDVRGRAFTLALAAEVTVVTLFQIGGMGLIWAVLLVAGLLMLAVWQVRLRYGVQTVVLTVVGAVALSSVLSLLLSVSLTILHRQVFSASAQIDSSTIGLAIVGGTLAVIMLVMLSAAAAIRRWLE